MSEQTKYDLCECSDPGCPACSGKCHRIAAYDLYRVDMQDEVGIAFCHPCADDAMKSGLFVDAEEDNQQEIDCPVCGSANAVSLGSLGTWLYCHCRDCGMDYSHENKSESGQASCGLAILIAIIGIIAIIVTFAPIFSSLFADLSF